MSAVCTASCTRLTKRTRRKRHVPTAHLVTFINSRPRKPALPIGTPPINTLTCSFTISYVCTNAGNRAAGVSEGAMYPCRKAAREKRDVMLHIACDGPQAILRRCHQTTMYKNGERQTSVRRCLYPSRPRQRAMSLSSTKQITAKAMSTHT